jgi:3-hydroxyisobutyrate dehydrogenase
MAVVAVLGAGGSMGSGMTRNLAHAGMGVRAWNRTREKAESLTGDGVEVLGSPAEAAAGADVIVTMLADTQAVLEAAESALPGVGGEAVWLQMSTIGKDGTGRCARFAREHGLAFVDAPVLGTRQPAQEGKLVVLASGPDELRDRVQPVFDAVGQRTMWLGPAGSGSRLKLATNMWVLTVTEGCAEAIAFTEGLGLDAAQLMEEAVRRHQLSLPLVAAIAQRMAEGAKENPDKDMSASYLTSTPATHLDTGRAR